MPIIPQCRTFDRSLATEHAAEQASIRAWDPASRFTRTGIACAPCGFFLAAFEVRLEAQDLFAVTVVLIDPRSGQSLEPSSPAQSKKAGAAYAPKPIVRTVDGSNYADNFGLQWNRFAEIQMDRENGGSRQSEERLFSETDWNPEELNGADLLEVGSGAGRFTRVLLEKTRANLWSLDYSNAVEANQLNNGKIAPDRFRLFQASIYEMPFADNSFDKVLCLGVLQHTPDFSASVRELIKKAKPGGEIVVDFYPIKGFWTKLHAKYLLRPLTKRMPHERLLGLIERHVDKLMAASAFLDRVGLHVLTRFLPVCDIRGTLPAQLTKRELRDWVILDTFDAFSPEYDNPQRLVAVARMFDLHGANVTFAGFVKNGPNSAAAVVRGIKR